jgi:putative hemolysin
MPKDFDNCVSAGGKVITKSLSNGKYIHLCKTSGGKWKSGHVKKAKSVAKRARSVGKRKTR